MMRAFLTSAVLIISACTSPTDSAIDPRDSADALQESGSPTTPATWTRGAMVSAANPHAVAAAAEILAKGGHAVDAAIAAHAVLGLVEPQSSGLGGSAFMLVYDRASDSLVVYDGREMAPAGATADMFMRDGEPMGFLDTWQSGFGVGVPGTVALYQLAHDTYGKLPWADLYRAAIELATDGFEVSPRLHNWLTRVQQVVNLDYGPVMADYLYPNRQPLPVGFLRKNPEYASTLNRIATEGGGAFYSGPIAEAIAARAQAAPHPGSISIVDIEKYEARTRDAICGAFRDDRICSVPPPSSGVAHIMIAGLYDQLLKDANASQADKIQLFVDAQRLAYADRDHFVADPDFVNVPVDALIDPQYIAHRATERFAPAAIPEHGDPAAVLKQSATGWNQGADTTREMVGTSHLSIIDVYGNAVSMTASVGAPFGSFRMTGGFLLNNQMSDFARNPTSNGQTVANVIAPGKRPRSSMSPTIIFDENGELLMLTGSPGGNSIIAYTTKTILAVLDWGFSAQAAADFPNIIARGESVRVENSVEPGAQIAADLAQRGYTVQERSGENSGVHIIVVHPDRLEGAADKRREGTVQAVKEINH